MDSKEIKETSVWGLYELGRNYHRRINLYSDTDRNYRMYNGNQWAGAKLGEVEPIQMNIIKPIVKYKQAVIHDNLYAIVYSSQNYEDTKFRQFAEQCCDMLNDYAAKIWEKDKMDKKGRTITKDGAINDEGIMYVDFDQKNMMPINEIIKKNDIYYGNENDEDIQAQPYIIIRKRMPVSNAQEYAINHGLSIDKLEYIVGDNDTFEESGEAAKTEKDNMVSLLFKMYKNEGSVHFSVSTRYVDIIKDTDIGISLYPVAHFTWEEKEGSARGEGEVRYLIPNQIEINKTLMRRAMTVKTQAYPQKVYDKTKIENPTALEKVGGIINTNGTPVEDIRKVVGVIQPAHMSSDVKQLNDELINMTRDLAGAGDSATGNVNVESTSGRAILAVQQASQAPMTEQKESYKNFIEDIAKIWLEYFIAYSVNGMNLEYKTTDPGTGEEVVEIRNVPQVALRKIQATVKIDVTPMSVYDRFAQEQTIENLLLQGYFSPNRVGELEVYEKLLPNNSVAPKMKIRQAIKYIHDNQRKIAQIDAEVQAMQIRANQFLNGDADFQAEQMAEAMALVNAEKSK